MDRSFSESVLAAEVIFPLVETRVAESTGSQDFGWSRIPKNIRSQIFYLIPEVQLNHFLHCTPM